MGAQGAPEKVADRPNRAGSAQVALAGWRGFHGGAAGLVMLSLLAAVAYAVDPESFLGGKGVGWWRAIHPAPLWCEGDGAALAGVP